MVFLSVIILFSADISKRIKDIKWKNYFLVYLQRYNINIINILKKKKNILFKKIRNSLSLYRIIVYRPNGLYL